MTRLRRSILVGITLIAITVSCVASESWAASWTTGLDILVALAPGDLSMVSSLQSELNWILKLALAGDRVAIAAGASPPIELRRDDDGQIALPTIEQLRELVVDQSSWPLADLLQAADTHFAQLNDPRLRPLLVVLDSGGLETSDQQEVQRLLDSLLHRHCLIAGIATELNGDLESLIAEHAALAFAPENEAAAHRAMVSILAEARGSSRLPLSDGYVAIDESCQQLTLLLTGHTGQPAVARPNGSLLEQDHPGLVYTEDEAGVTITIPNPDPGYWRVLGDGWSGEALLASPLRLGRMPLLPRYTVGEPITLLAYLANGDRLSPDSYPYTLSIDVELLGPSHLVERVPFHDDGRHGDGAAGDGLYGAQLRLNIPGPYQLRYQLKRGLLTREETVGLWVVEPDGLERLYTLSPERIDLPRLVPGRTYERTITLTSHLPRAERFRLEIGDDHTDLRSFGELVVTPSEVELAPGESRTITVAVRLQPKAVLGGYAGYLRLLPVTTMQRGQIVPLRLGVVSWPMAHWHWLAAGGACILAAMVTVSVVLSRPQLHGWLTNETLGGRERIQLHGYHFLPSPASHRSYLVAARNGTFVSVHLCVDRRDPPVLLNGLPVKQRTPISDGDQLRFGQVIWEYREDDPADGP